MKKKRSEQRKRTAYIRARVTPEEKARFLLRCDASGLTTGEYIRSKCLDEKPLRAIRRVNVDRKLITQALGQIIRYGNLLNQVARHLNQTRWVGKRDLKAIRVALTRFYDLRLMFRQSLGYDS